MREQTPERLCLQPGFVLAGQVMFHLVATH